MMDETSTILDNIKKQLNIESITTEFDSDIRSLANGAFFTMYQLGIGGSSPFNITEETTWEEFDTSIPKDVVLDYLVLKVKMIFDPPQSSGLVDAYKDRISELEFRMNIEVDSGGGVVSG